MPRILLSLVALAAVVAASEDSWENTEQTDRVYKIITEFDNDALTDLIEVEKDAINARSEDGRGALFWAYEYKNGRAVELLLAAGADSGAKDANGNPKPGVKTCTPTFCQ